MVPLRFALARVSSCLSRLQTTQSLPGLTLTQMVGWGAEEALGLTRT
jgi:hypothetical protein